jgi:hypothetical protein
VKALTSLYYLHQNGIIIIRKQYKSYHQIAPEIRVGRINNKGTLCIDTNPIRITFLNATTKNECTVTVSERQFLTHLLKSDCPFKDSNYEFSIVNGISKKKLSISSNATIKEAGIVDGSVIELSNTNLVIRNFDRAMEHALVEIPEKGESTPSTDMDYSLMDIKSESFQITPSLKEHYGRYFEACKKNSKDPSIDLDYKALKFVFRELVKLRTVISKDLKPRKSSPDHLN